MSDTNKPTFDPNQPYQVAPKPAFDPNQSYTTAAPATPEAPSGGEAFLRGAGNGLALGAEPVVAGGLQAAGSLADQVMSGKLSLDDVLASYRNRRDSENKANEAAASAHPWLSAAGNIAGSLPLTLLTGGASEGAEAAVLGDRMLGAAKVGAGFGAANGLGTALSNGEGAMDTLKSTGKGLATGAVMGPAVEAGLTGLKNLPSGIANIGDSLKGFAEDQALKAGGATGAQARNFAPGTGRAMLDNKVVTFGKNQAGIAEAAAKQLQSAGQDIGTSIQNLTANGAAASKADVIAGIQAEIAKIGDDPAGVYTVRQLKSVLDDVAAGPDNPTLTQLEKTKSGFADRVNYDSPEQNDDANRAVASVYRNLGEDSAGLGNGVNTQDAQKFADGKELYGQLKPFAEAADKRAFQQAQSPTGGFSDMLGYTAGGAPAVVAKKLLMPRINSSVAVTADALGNQLNKVGNMVSTSSVGTAIKSLYNTASPAAMKLSQALMPALTQSGVQRNATLFTLMQQPGYRELLKQHLGMTDDSNPNP